MLRRGALGGSTVKTNGASWFQGDGVICLSLQSTDAYLTGIVLSTVTAAILFVNTTEIRFPASRASVVWVRP